MEILRFVAIAVAICACVETPQDRARAALGDVDHHWIDSTGRDRGTGSRHRAGQPCLYCHDFEVAGTIYTTASGSEPAQGATVRVLDDNGDLFQVQTNETGNFYIAQDDADDPGGLRVNAPLAFPLHVEVSFEGETQEMESAINREGSCSACHGPHGTTGADLEPVFTMETP